MAFGGFDQGQSQPMSDINVTPLVDVMLVLLVIFLVTAPLFTHAVRVDLPQARAQPTTDKPENVALAVDEHGLVYWNREAVTAGDRGSRRPPRANRSPKSTCTPIATPAIKRSPKSWRRCRRRACARWDSLSIRPGNTDNATPRRLAIVPTTRARGRRCASARLRESAQTEPGVATSRRVTH